MNLIALYTQVTTIVSDDHVVTKTSPLSRSIELLVDVTIESECRNPNLSFKR